MPFRNVKSSIPLEKDTCQLVQLVDDEFRPVNFDLSLPSSSDYSLKDMLAAGVKVPLVDPTVVHDSDVTSSVVSSVVNSESVADVADVAGDDGDVAK